MIHAEARIQNPAWLDGSQRVEKICMRMAVQSGDDRYKFNIQVHPALSALLILADLSLLLGWSC